MPDTAAHAGAITRALVAAGLPRSVQTKSGTVRGYSTSTRGVRSTQVLERSRQRISRPGRPGGAPRVGWSSTSVPTGYVTVEYVHDRGSRDAEGRTEEATAALTRAAEVLRGKGFTVTVHAGPGGGQPSLSVCRRDARGDVIR